MAWETLPDWFWMIYYFVLFITFVSAILCIIRKKMRIPSTIALILSATIPIISLLFSIGRADGMNEFEHLLFELQKGAIWSLYVTFGYLFLIIWWILFFNKKSKKA